MIRWKKTVLAGGLGGRCGINLDWYGHYGADVQEFPGFIIDRV